MSHVVSENYILEVQPVRLEPVLECVVSFLKHGANGNCPVYWSKGLEHPSKQAFLEFLISPSVVILEYFKNHQRYKELERLLEPGMHAPEYCLVEIQDANHPLGAAVDATDQEKFDLLQAFDQYCGLPWSLEEDRRSEDDSWEAWYPLIDICVGTSRKSLREILPELPIANKVLRPGSQVEQETLNELATERLSPGSVTG